MESDGDGDGGRAANVNKRIYATNIAREWGGKENKWKMDTFWVREVGGINK